MTSIEENSTIDDGLMDEIDKDEATRWIESVEPAVAKACVRNGHVDEECVQSVRMALYCEMTRTFPVHFASANMRKSH